MWAGGSGGWIEGWRQVEFVIVIGFNGIFSFVLCSSVCVAKNITIITQNNINNSSYFLRKFHSNVDQHKCYHKMYISFHFMTIANQA